ncbi:Ig-like domain-containing protein, partial [Pantoea sp.]|uniref:Ig-like domain-containing protein n=1 Tax=Pantoea sp. TaxID=69393 RepID=UPI0031CEA0CC
MPRWEAPENSKGTPPVHIEQRFTNNLGYDVAFMSGSEIVDPTPRFVGSTGPNFIVYAWDNGTIIGSTRSAADGSWSFSPQLLDGQHSLTFGLHKDVVSLPIEFSINSAAAIPVIVSQRYTDDLGYDVGIWPGQEIVDSTPRFIGTAAPESIIYAWDAGKLLGSTVSDEDGNWSFETNLEDGKHALTFGVEKDSATPSFEFSINSAAAIPVIVSQRYTDDLGYDVGIWPGQEIVDSTPRFIGTAAPESIIYAWDAGKLLGSTVS